MSERHVTPLPHDLPIAIIRHLAVAVSKYDKIARHALPLELRWWMGVESAVMETWEVIVMKGGKPDRVAFREAVDAKAAAEGVCRCPLSRVGGPSIPMRAQVYRTDRPGTCYPFYDLQKR